MTLKKKPITRPALKTWVDLNACLMKTTDERKLEDLLRAERKGRNRKMFVRRIQSRLRRLASQSVLKALDQRFAK